MNARAQLSPTLPRSTFPVEHLTADQYVEQVTDQYRRGCALSDLTCKRLARIALCREVGRFVGARFSYRQACNLLP